MREESGSGESLEDRAGVIDPPDVPPAFNLGLCGEGVIRQKQQRELDEDIDAIRAIRILSMANASRKVVD